MMIARNQFREVNPFGCNLFCCQDPKSSNMQEIELNGDNLTIEDLIKCADKSVTIKISKAAEERVARSRNFVKRIVSEKRVVYGVTTGFGFFANVGIADDKLIELQQNLIRSHCCGVGAPLSPYRARVLLALRVNVLAKGHSGISLETLRQMIDAFNAYCVSWVPEKGSVGCSGDLAPLAHLSLGLMGEGQMWSPETGWTDAPRVLQSHGLRPLRLQAKEGLAMINGTQLIVALGAEAVFRAGRLARQADVIAALTVEALRGSVNPFAEVIQQTRPHKGQSVVAERLRNLLHSKNNHSSIAASHKHCSKVQDPYSLRCIPQVHGIVNDTIDFARHILSTELNSATDNPLIFAENESILSNGNFHGEYPGKALDYLAIGIHELAQISERRIERLLNSDHSGFPSFLINGGGLNSGLMMVQVTAASLVSENKVLCHPSTCDSIPTNVGQEDHVSMATFAARKALTVIENVEQVLAIELLCACQALEFLKPLKSTVLLQAVYDLVRSVVKPLVTDRPLSPDIEAVVQLLLENKVWDAIGEIDARTATTPEISRMSSDEAISSGSSSVEFVYATQNSSSASDD